jgi:tetratricopeptide (TPR) repeat protein
VKAAVLYYGSVPEGALRSDLPVLFLVAESDAPRLGESLPALWGRIIDERAPWTLTFGSRMPHGFDAFSDDDEARRHVQLTLAFWKAHLEPVPQPGWERSAAREIVATLYANDAARAADLLASHTLANPRDAEAFRQHARVLVQLQRYAAADSAYQRAYVLDSTHPGLLSGLGQMRIGQQRWGEGAELLERAIAGGVEHSFILGQLGWAQLHLGRNAEAARSYERAFELGIPPGRSTRGIAWYNLACAYARLGQADRAIEALEQAFSEGVDDRRTYEQDSDLASLRSNPRFRALIDRMQG